MTVTLSTKGQLVIPKEIRKALSLQAGTKFAVELHQGQILLKPVVDVKRYRAVIDRLYGKFARSGLLDDLAAERQLELSRDQARGL